MDRILVFRRFIYLPSETFIRTQVAHLAKSFKIFLLAEGFVNEAVNCNFRVQKVKLNPVEKVLRKCASKLFHTNSHPQFQFYNSLQVSRLLKRQKIQLIHAHFGTDAMKILRVAQRNAVPLVVTFHGFDASRELNNEWYKSHLPELFEYASKIIVVSRHMIETLALERWKEKVVVLPCSVDVDEFLPFDKQATDTIVLLHSGRLVSKKGVPDLIRVFANIYKMNRNIRLTVLGDGPELAICKEEARKKDLLDVVSFLGKQPHVAVKQALNEADIFILNSRTAEDGDMEGTPVGLLEAMSMEKAVVSTFHAGISDVIQSDLNGMLVPEKDSASLERAITKLISDRQKREELGKNARQTVIAKYSHEAILPKLNKTILEVLNRTPAV